MLQLRVGKPLLWKVFIAMASVLLCASFLGMFAKSAFAHGYTESPASRSYLCKQGINTGCGQIQYEPQSLEARGSFPQGGPADGQITGAGKYPELYAQTSTRWAKVDMNGGMNTFTWNLTAAHATAEWKYYITKIGWDPNKPLARADLEPQPFCYSNDGGVRPGFTVTHQCNVPNDRSGYYLILAVWEISDTGNAFYNVIDVNLNGNPGDDKEAPSVPTNLTVTGKTTSSVSLAWSKSTDNVGVKNYSIYRDGSYVATVNSPMLTYTDTGLSAGVTYSYTVRASDAAGNLSGPSSSVSATAIGNNGSTTWAPNVAYATGAQVTYNGILYECRQSHTSLPGWEPPNVPALWLKK